MADTEHVREELLKAVSLLSTADYLTKKGRLVSIAALGGMVADICRGFAEAGDEERAPLEPLLRDLMKRVDAFGAELERRYAFLHTTADGE